MTLADQLWREEARELQIRLRAIEVLAKASAPKQRRRRAKRFCNASIVLSWGK